MRLRWVAFAAVALLSLSAGLLRAETVNESWRSPFGSALAAAVDETDGSCWAVTGGSVMHLAADGSILSQTNGFRSPNSLAVDIGDGSCWVADSYSGRVVHLGADGAILWEGWDFTYPLSVSVDPTDGSCWVADQGLLNSTGTAYVNAAVVRLSAAGAVLWKGTGFLGPSAVSVDTGDRSVWVAEQGLQDGGTGNYLGSAVAHLTMDGVLLWQGGTFNGPFAVSADPGDGSCWVADTLNGAVVHLASTGPELSRTSGYGGPVSVSVDSYDGSCWVADLVSGLVSHLSSAGIELWFGGEAEGFWSPAGVAADSGDGSCWVADMDFCAVTHLDAAGI